MNALTLKSFAAAALAGGIALASAVGVSTAVLAQQPPGPMPPRGDGPGPRMLERGGPDGAMAMLRGIELTREQRAKVYDLLEPTRNERQQQTRERFIEGPGDGMNEIRELIASGKLTKKDAVRIATERADQLKKRIVEQAEILGAIYEDVLTDEQRQVLKDRASQPREARGPRRFRRGDNPEGQPGGPAMFEGRGRDARPGAGGSPRVL